MHRIGHLVARRGAGKGTFVTRALVLFTTNHPFTHTGGETTFVEPELPHLATRFDDLRAVPLYDDGAELPLPPGVTLDRTLATRWRKRRAAHYVLAPRWPGFWRELLQGLRRGGWVGAARVWRWAAVAGATWSWMLDRLSVQQPTLFYTFWRGGQTLAAVRWARAHRASLAVTRVHRYELYDEAFDPPFQPWTEVYEHLARVFVIAQHGADYLASRGIAPCRLRLARLGVVATPRRAAASADGVLRIVSCSNVVALKRVERIAEALVALATRHPDRRIEWTHFGAGPALPAVQRALQGRPANLGVTQAGHMANERVLQHYRSEPVDLLVLLSRSEGLPVSIQEALAHGIPVLATDVGGVAEAVPADADNGILLPAEPALEAVVEALERLWLASADVTAARREGAYRRWAQDFDASRTRGKLAAELAALDFDRT